MFLSPARLYTRGEVLARPCPVPAAAGVYGWWFDTLPAAIDTSGCQQHAGYTLLYTGNAGGSTLRKTLGCLLADELGIQLRRVGSGTRMTFLTGERELSQ